MLKIGRNEKCVCGSGKKYKKCCMVVLNVPTLKIIFPEDKVPNNGKKVMWRTSVSNLKNNEVRKDVEKFIDETELYSNCCHYVANLLSIEVDGIDVVKGWYGYKEKDEETFMYKLSVEHQFNEVKNINNRWVEARTIHGNFRYYDMENNIIWYQHSWNKCEGQYIDLSTELNDDVRWVYYKEDQVKNMSLFRLNELSATMIKEKCEDLMYRDGFSSHLPHNKLNNTIGAN